jgi:hypothetical protein
MLDINNSQLDENTIKLYLIYAQSIELQNLYFQQISKNYVPLKYYLFPKQWLDDYKTKYNYSLVKKNNKPEDCQDYNSFKSRLLNRINDSKRNNLDIEFPVRLATDSILKQNIHYPKDFVPIRQDIFENVHNNNLLYEMVIGEENIFIFDNNSDKNIFICTLNLEDDDEDGEFIVNVDGILKLNDKKKSREKKKLFNLISESKGINNYYKERNINVKEKGEQKVNDRNGEEIGFYYQINLKNDEYKTPDGFLEEYTNELLNPNEIINNNNNINNNIIGVPKNINIAKMNDNDDDATYVQLQTFFNKQRLNIQNNNESSQNRIDRNININNRGQFDQNPLGYNREPVQNNQLNDINNINRNNSNAYVKRSKCITIRGDIYYYIKKKNIFKNNCQVFEYTYNNNMNNNNINNNNNIFSDNHININNNRNINYYNNNRAYNRNNTFN